MIDGVYELFIPSSFSPATIIIFPSSHLLWWLSSFPLQRGQGPVLRGKLTLAPQRQTNHRQPRKLKLNDHFVDSYEDLAIVNNYSLIRGVCVWGRKRCQQLGQYYRLERVQVLWVR